MGKTKNQRMAAAMKRQEQVQPGEQDLEVDGSTATSATAVEAMDVKTAAGMSRVQPKTEKYAKYRGSRAYNIKTYDGLVGHPKLAQVMSFLLFASYAAFVMALFAVTMMTTPITGTFVMEVMGIPEDGSLLTVLAFWLLPSVFLMVVIAIAECKLVGVVWRRIIAPMVARLYDVRQQSNV